MEMISGYWIESVLNGIKPTEPARQGSGILLHLGKVFQFILKMFVFLLLQLIICALKVTSDCARCMQMVVRKQGNVRRVQPGRIMVQRKNQGNVQYRLTFSAPSDKTTRPKNQASEGIAFGILPASSQMETQLVVCH